MEPQAEVLTERQVAAYRNMSAAVMLKWRRFRQDPKFVRIGWLRRDVETLQPTRCRGGKNKVSFDLVEENPA
jgi:hypothetical protein